MEQDCINPVGCVFGCSIERIQMVCASNYKTMKVKTMQYYTTTVRLPAVTIACPPELNQQTPQFHACAKNNGYMNPLLVTIHVHAIKTKSHACDIVFHYMQCHPFTQPKRLSAYAKLRKSQVHEWTIKVRSHSAK